MEAKELARACYRTFESRLGRNGLFHLRSLEANGFPGISTLPYSLKVLLEGLLRSAAVTGASQADLACLAGWSGGAAEGREVAFLPARVLLQDFTGVPCVADLAAMRSAMARLGGDPARVNPLAPVDLVIDHSVQVDWFGSRAAAPHNAAREFERNGERYRFLRWGQGAFRDFRVVPPATGICHQVNLEHLSSVVQVRRSAGGEPVAFPDSLVGTDSHTTMINGLGVVGWGVGGIEAEAVMLGQPVHLVTPEVIGVRLTGELPEGTTATDLVLAITELLRRRGVVDKFIEFFGPGAAGLTLADRATVANMAPEYGATMGYFPVDAETLRYLRLTGRSEGQVDLVERYAKEQGLFAGESPDARYTEVLAFDMGSVEPSIAGPGRPQDRIPLRRTREVFGEALARARAARPSGGPPAGARAPAAVDGTEFFLADGSVVIASITSCTNTSNPSVMLGAGLLARNAVAAGLSVRPWVKTSFAPGSRVVTRYLEAAGLLAYLEALRFHVVGYGCATCIGNSGPLPAAVEEAVRSQGLTVASVLSGNRNFEGRIHALTRLNYLASPPLVVAYALAGRVDIDFDAEPLGLDPNGQPVFLRDLWPSRHDLEAAARQGLAPELFASEYAEVDRGSEAWRQIETPSGSEYPWEPSSTYIQEPPFFTGVGREPLTPAAVVGARVLAWLGDSVTTDHISPAGAIAPQSPAGRFLAERGVAAADFNSYGARRGNHHVMVRGTFANLRLRNRLAPDTEGGFTRHLPTGEVTSIYDAASRYLAEGTPVVILAGRDYGMGSSRDWAAKGTKLLGVRAVLAESFERIHRSNLVGMGVLPLQFRPGESAEALGLTGEEVFAIEGLGDAPEPRRELRVEAVRPGAAPIIFSVVARVDTAAEVGYYRHGGVLPAVLRRLLEEAG